MDSAKLSKLYFLACSRSQDVLKELYENLHTYKGDPLGEGEHEYEYIKQTIQSTIKEIRQELSLIYSALEE